MTEELHVNVAAATHPGQRRVNADAFVTYDAGGLFAVADGMRDALASSVAARLVVESVRARFGEPWAWLPIHERSPDEAAERLARGVAHAHARLYAAGPSDQKRIGATFAGIVLCGPGGRTLCVAHVGDSRILLLRRREATLVQLTLDHTAWVEGAEQRVAVPSASGVFQRHVLTRAVGATRAAPPDIGTAVWEPGDIALLCTNGVSDRVSPEELGEVLLEERDLRAAARRIVYQAITAGGWDNATVLLVQNQRMHDAGSVSPSARVSARPEEKSGVWSILRQRLLRTPDYLFGGSRGTTPPCSGVSAARAAAYCPAPHWIWS